MSITPLVEAPATLTATVQATTPPRVQVVATNLTEVAAGLLTNPSFEDGTTGWTIPSGVTAALWPEQAPDPAAAVPAYDGTRYLHWAATAAGRLAYQTAAIPREGDFYARAQVWGTTGTARLRLVPVIAGVDQTDLIVTDELEVDPTVWQELVTPNVTITAAHDHIRVELWTTTAGEGGIDAAQIVEVGSEPGTITITRTAEGDTAPVRGALEVEPRGATWIVVDNEAPFGVPITYTLLQTSADGITRSTVSNTVVLDGVTLPWLTLPITGDGVSATIAEWPDLAYGIRRSLVEVSGRAAPLAISDVRSLPASEMVVLTRTRDQLLALRRLLASGDVIQVRPVCGAVEAAYLSVGEVTESRYKPVGDGAGSDWRRLVTLDVQAVDQPTPRIPAVGDTLADLHAFVPTTLADLAVAFGPDATLLTIAQTHLAGDSDA